ncbi:hypothetical protein HAPAU_35540 [Halalkalicoccus paucihalophilus]|uniref:Uncharacterized protein n=1 Tax=Halalkalicoccus paucihalophilus TaxID=1008153 RepID=A0A151AA58_9EURY|nr:hypothetical protein HAPAU_35540 [Halalkalicoccus paucihalophilus]
MENFVSDTTDLLEKTTNEITVVLSFLKILLKSRPIRRNKLDIMPETTLIDSIRCPNIFVIEEIM